MSENNGTVATTPMNGQIQAAGMTTIDHGMKFRAVMMTPVVAEQLLKHNHPRNRKPKPRRIGLYAQDIVNKEWYLTHEAVAIDEDGWLIDGQNRLNAIIQADTPAPVLLVTNVPKKSLFVVDQGAGRTCSDMAKVQKFSDDMPSISNWLGASRSMMLGIKSATFKARTAPPTNQEQLAFLKIHKDAVEFAMELLPMNSQTRGVARAPVRGVLARAYYQPKTKHDRIRQFADVLISGIPDGKKDTSAIRLRNWLLDINGGRRRREGMSVRPQMIYARTQTALKAFIEERPMELLKEVSSEEFFKLPGE